MLVWILPLLGCAKQTPAEPAPSSAASASHERSHARKSGAPVGLDAQVGKDSSTVTASFEGAGADVQILAWGASGLQVVGEKLRWEGEAEVGKPVTFEVLHAGEGDLAVRVVGTFAGERVDEVRSWTVGTHRPTPVPVQAGSKGWDATRQ